LKKISMLKAAESLVYVILVFTGLKIFIFVLTSCIVTWALVILYFQEQGKTHLIESIGKALKMFNFYLFGFIVSGTAHYIIKLIKKKNDKLYPLK